MFFSVVVPQLEVEVSPYWGEFCMCDSHIPSSGEVQVRCVSVAAIYQPGI